LVRDAVADLGLEDRAFAWTGPMTDTGDQRLLLAQAWDLDDVERRYLEFLRDFGRREASGDLEAYVAQVQLIEAWRRFPFLDPDLPRELLDHDWPGPRAADAFHDRHRRWEKGAQHAWEGFQASGAGRP
jgi:phenylacetic acid degradation operon negative regulatory protein